jgi:hypothetical protein
LLDWLAKTPETAENRDDHRGSDRAEQGRAVRPDGWRRSGRNVDRSRSGRRRRAQGIQHLVVDLPQDIALRYGLGLGHRGRGHGHSRHLDGGSGRHGRRLLSESLPESRPDLAQSGPLGGIAQQHPLQDRPQRRVVLDLQGQGEGELHRRGIPGRNRATEQMAGSETEREDVRAGGGNAAVGQLGSEEARGFRRSRGPDAKNRTAQSQHRHPRSAACAGHGEQVVRRHVAMGEPARCQCLQSVQGLTEEGHAGVGRQLGAE